MHCSPKAKQELDGKHVATEHDMRDALSHMVEAAGSQTSVAREIGISVSYLGDILHGRRGVSAEVAGKLGRKAVTVFVSQS